MEDTILSWVTHGVARIEAAGLLPDLMADFGAERRGWPANDLLRYPLRTALAHRIGQAVSMLLGFSLQRCKDAAIEELLDSPRQRVVLELIDMYLARIDGTSPPKPNEKRSAISVAVATDDPLLASEQKRRQA